MAQRNVTQAEQGKRQKQADRRTPKVIASGNNRHVPRDGGSAAVEQDELYRLEVAELAALADRVSRARAGVLAARMIKEQDLVPRAVDGGPTNTELMTAMLDAIRESGRNQVGTFAGAHNIALKVARDLEVPGAAGFPLYRRSRSQVDESPNPEQPREGASRPRSGRYSVPAGEQGMDR